MANKKSPKASDLKDCVGALEDVLGVLRAAHTAAAEAGDEVRRMQLNHIVDMADRARQVLARLLK